MADSIIIRFATQNLERARATAKEIAAKVKEAARALKDVAPEARKAYLKQVRASAKDRDAEIKAEERRLALEKRVAAVRSSDASAAADRAASAQVGKLLRGFHRLGSFAGGLAAVVTQENTTTKGLQIGLHGLEAFAPLLGPAGPVVAAVAGIVSQALSVLDARAEKRIQAAERSLRETIEAHLAEAVSATRFEKDPGYAAKLRREASFLYVQQRGTGWEPRGARLLHGQD